MDRAGGDLRVGWPASEPALAHTTAPRWPRPRRPRATAWPASGWPGHDAQARAGFGASLAIAPDDVEAILGLAGLACASDTAAARAYYRRALAVAPGQPEAEAGLAALDALRRVELRLAVERDLVDAGPLRGEAAVTVERDRGWRYRLGLATVDRGQPLVDDAGDGWFGAAGVQRRGRALAVAVGAELGRDAGAGFVGATGEVGYRFGAVGVSAAGRLRRTADAWRDLSSLGVEAPVGGGVVVGARGFVAIADGAQAAVGQLGWHRGALATRVELTVAPGGAALDGVGAMAGVDPGGRWAVVARGRWRAEPSVATVGLEVVTRF
ncbi:MAG: hypothetical protein R3B06_10860 [Kofleriaceae bacterium]